MQSRFKVTRISTGTTTVAVTMKPEDRTLPTLNLYGKNASFANEYTKGDVYTVTFAKERE